MSATLRKPSGIRVKTRGSFYSAVIVQKNYEHPSDPTRNAWSFDWLYNNRGIQEGRDEKLGEKLKRDIEMTGIRCFEEKIARLIGQEPFRVSLTAQDLNDRWKVCESDQKLFTFFIPQGIDWSQFEFRVLNAGK